MSTLLKDALKEHKGSFDFGGLFFTLAVKEGGSEDMHLDWGDSPFSLAIITSVGDRAAYFCIPQLGIKIPLYPGQFLAVASRLLSHYMCYVQDADSNAKSKRRVVIVAFCDALILAHADNWKMRPL